MKPDKLKIGIIGAGVFGNYHASKCAAHPRLDFVGVYDPDKTRRETTAKAQNTNAYDNCNTLLYDVDAVIVACIAQHHGPVATTALRAGKHVLVEKPIAADLEHAQTMVRLAKENNLALQVGHQERFVARAIGLDTAPHKPTGFQTLRFGPVAIRGTDVSVTLDLMTHDLDMVMWLMDERPERIEGEALRVYSEQPDAALANLTFTGGTKARIEASRCEDGPKRIMRIEYPDGHVEIDFVNKTFEDTTGYGFNPDFADHPIARDSLGAGTNSFVASVLDGTPIAIPGQAGLDALEMALHIDGRLTSQT